MKLHLTILITSCLLISANSFGQKKLKEILLKSTSMEAGAIPPNMDFTETLGIEYGITNGATRRMKKIIKKNYNGKFAFDDGTIKFRYILKNRTERRSYESPNSSGVPETNTLNFWVFYILDTKTGKEYHNNVTTHNAVAYLTAYMTNLEKERLKSK